MAPYIGLTILLWGEINYSLKAPIPQVVQACLDRQRLQPKEEEEEQEQE